MREWLEDDVPPEIPYTSVFSLDDGVIDWRACLDPGATHLEVSATHMSMGADDEVIAVVADLLGPLVPAELAA